MNGAGGLNDKALTPDELFTGPAPVLPVDTSVMHLARSTVTYRETDVAPAHTGAGAGATRTVTP